MRKALVVGINDYPTSPLRGCINDAEAVTNLIGRNGDNSINFDVKFEKNVSSKSKLMHLVKNLFSGNNETALFYFSGHGFLNELGGGYIVTPDARQNDEGLLMDELLNIANHSEADNRVIILDCCHSGAMGAPVLAGGSTAHVAEGLTVLTASRNTEKAVEINGHGLFTNLLLKALEGGAADLRGHITPGSVYAYIDQALGPWSQRPVFKTNITRFISLRTINPQVPLDMLRKITDYFPEPVNELNLSPEYEYTDRNARPEKTSIFKHLQKFQSVGLVTPVGEEHMYWAAMHSKSCKLTTLGQHYWRLVKDNRI